MSFKNRIPLSAMLLTLSAPLGAKCPSNFVEVHGKIECAFKPDARVLVRLIYAGEENALDVRGDSFKGEVTFNTFSSNSFLKGDRSWKRKQPLQSVRMLSCMAGVNPGARTANLSHAQIQNNFRMEASLLISKCSLLATQTPSFT
jgi:hypothetical protein